MSMPLYLFHVYNMPLYLSHVYARGYVLGCPRVAELTWRSNAVQVDDVSEQEMHGRPAQVYYRPTACNPD